MMSMITIVPNVNNSAPTFKIYKHTYLHISLKAIRHTPYFLLEQVTMAAYDLKAAKSNRRGRSEETRDDGRSRSGGDQSTVRGLERLPEGARTSFHRAQPMPPVAPQQQHPQAPTFRPQQRQTGNTNQNNVQRLAQLQLSPQTLQELVLMVALQGQFTDDSVRELYGKVATTFILKQPDPLIAILDETLRDYHQAVKNQGRGHALGPPGVHIVFKLLENLITRTEVTSKTDMTYWLQQNGEPNQAASILGICRFTKMYNHEHRKLVISWNDDVMEETIQALLAIGAERKSGAAPRGPVSRRIQEILDNGQ
jgi:hypothetical protein